MVDAASASTKFVYQIAERPRRHEVAPKAHAGHGGECTNQRLNAKGLTPVAQWTR